MSTAYWTLADLEAAVTRRRLIETTNDEDPTETGDIDLVKVDEAIGRAGDIIDSYIGKRFTLPLPLPVPTLLSRLAVDITVHSLYARVQDGEMAQGVKNRYDAAIRLLELIQRGDASLGVPTAESTADPVTPLVSHPPAVFTAGRLARMNDDIRPGFGWR